MRDKHKNDALCVVPARARAPPATDRPTAARTAVAQFFQMGFAEKAARSRVRDAAQKQHARKETDLALAQQAKVKTFQDGQVSWQFRESDRRSALKKLTAASVAYAQGGLRVTGTAGLKVTPATPRLRTRSAVAIIIIPGPLSAAARRAIQPPTPPSVASEESRG